MYSKRAHERSKQSVLGAKYAASRTLDAQAGARGRRRGTHRTPLAGRPRLAVPGWSGRRRRSALTDSQAALSGACAPKSPPGARTAKVNLGLGGWWCVCCWRKEERKMRIKGRCGMAREVEGGSAERSGGRKERGEGRRGGWRRQVASGGRREEGRRGEGRKGKERRGVKENVKGLGEEVGHGLGMRREGGGSQQGPKGGRERGRGGERP
eukprot:5363-Rhodomonas_salina.1